LSNKQNFKILFEICQITKILKFTESRYWKLQFFLQNSKLVQKLKYFWVINFLKFYKNLHILTRNHKILLRLNTMKLIQPSRLWIKFKENYINKRSKISTECTSNAEQDFLTRKFQKETFNLKQCRNNFHFRKFMFKKLLWLIGQQSTMMDDVENCISCSNILFINKHINIYFMATHNTFTILHAHKCTSS